MSSHAPGQGPSSLQVFAAALARCPDGALDDDQRRVLFHDFNTPLWVVAGPGTGKTHTLVWLVLRRLLVDGIAPDRLVLTTFTRRAAAELTERLFRFREQLVAAGCSGAETLDLAAVRIGTLHALCYQLLRESRFAPTWGMHLLPSRHAQQFFLHKTRNEIIRLEDLAFWERFGVAARGENEPLAPETWKRVEKASNLFNRLTEHGVDPARLSETGDRALGQLAHCFQAYQADLRAHQRMDLAQLQRHFLDYLQSPAGQAWVGDGLCVMVDEYQDTNVVQEDIYFALAGRRMDLMVVGDEDQSIYRFRGATVEALIGFDRACQARDRVLPTRVFLRENRRSHPDVVAWVNRFIRHHPAMRTAGTDFRVRTPDKPSLEARSRFTGAYNGVLTIVRSTHAEAAAEVAGLIAELRAEGYITNLNQVALLAYSTRETGFGVGEYVSALEDEGIAYHNPRSHSSISARYILGLVGAFCEMLGIPGRQLPGELPLAARIYDEGKTLHPRLAAYVQDVADAIRAQRPLPGTGGHFLYRRAHERETLLGLCYGLFGHEPFAAYLAQDVAGERLRAFACALAEYQALFDAGEIPLEVGPDGRSAVAAHARESFRGVFLSTISRGLTDPDDAGGPRDEMVNVFTIHQAKGLEFDVVFVLKPEGQHGPDDTHLLEELLRDFTAQPGREMRLRAAVDRAAEDVARLYYVAYSRARRLLVIVNGHPSPRWERALGCLPDGAPLTRSRLAMVGVPEL